MSRSLKFTPQQQAILDAETKGLSVAVSAGAGCGKTFVLTQRFLNYLRPAEGRADPLSRIVAITFTEKAGREMRHRVRAACQQELLACDDEHVPYWLGVLRGLDTARISTIHAYCATLLRTHAVEAGLDPAFGLLDSSFGDLFAMRAVSEGLCRLLEANDDDATGLVLRFGFERSCTLLRGLLDGVRTTDTASIEQHTPDSLIAVWRDYWAAECVPMLLRELWDSPDVRQLVRLLREHEPSHPVMQMRRQVLLDLLTADPGTNPHVLERLSEHAKVQGGGGAKAWNDADIYEAVKEGCTAFRNRCKKLQDTVNKADGDGTDAATVALSVHRVARQVAKRYTVRKQEEARLDFDDLLCLTRDLLRDNLHVRRRAAAGIDLLMVDEFQDTDPVQADLVRLLCGEMLTTGKLFLVGDAKQSIYRFRRADPRVFAALRNELPEPGRLPLTTNFRSQPAILQFVNDTFAAEIPDYEPLEPADPVQYSPGKCVEFLFATAEGEKTPADERRRTEARWMAARIAQLLADETPRVLDSKTKELRRVRPGDVAILFRTLSNVHLYEQALVEQGLDYYLAGGRAFFAQQETFDLAHLCRWLDDPIDELSLAGVLRSPMFGLTDDTLMLLKPEGRSSLFAGLASPPAHLPETQDEQVRRAYRILCELREKKDRLPLAALLTLAVERTGYDAALLCEHLGPRKLANLRKLIGLARTFDAAGPFTLSEFVSRLKDAVREEADEEMAVTHPEVSDVLRLMTIHQAKGLEFPVVVVAAMDWRRSGGDARPCYHPLLGPLFPLPDEGDGRPPHLGVLIHREIESREEQQEQARLLYVAVTRARDHLILSAGMEHDRKPRSPWLQLLARRFDLTTGMPALDPYFGTFSGGARLPDRNVDILVHHAEPVPPERATKHRTDRDPLRHFRELVSEATPEPLPPLIGQVPPDIAHRCEFTVTDLCRADRSVRGTGACEDDAFVEKAFMDKRTLLGENTGDETATYAQIVGVAAHGVLERLDFSNPALHDRKSLGPLVERCLLTTRGDVDPQIHRRVLNTVASLVASPLREELASAKRMHREVEFRLRWPCKRQVPPVELIGVIDCFYQDRDDRWHLLDYKAVTSTRVGEQELIDSYELQLLLYAIAVERMFGTRPASARLVRLGPPLLLYDISVTTDRITAASERIDAAISALRQMPDR